MDKYCASDCQSSVEDEELLDKLAEIFESHFDELYESADEE